MHFNTELLLNKTNSVNNNTGISTRVRVLWKEMDTLGMLKINK